MHAPNVLERLIAAAERNWLEQPLEESNAADGAAAAAVALSVAVACSLWLRLRLRLRMRWLAFAAAAQETG